MQRNTRGAARRGRRWPWVALVLGAGCAADEPAPVHTDLADTAVVSAATDAPFDTDVSYDTRSDVPLDSEVPLDTDVATDTDAPFDTDRSYDTHSDAPFDTDVSYDTHTDAPLDTDSGLSGDTGAPPACRWFEGAAQAWARDGTFDGHRSYLVCTADPLRSAACDAIAAQTQTRPRPGGPNAALQDLIDEILGVPMCPIDTDSGSPGETGWDTAGACRMYAWDVVHTCGPVDDGTHTCCFTVRLSFWDIP